jgi:hypothetical protein
MKCILEGPDPNKASQDFYQAYINRAEADFDRLFEGYDATSGWIPVAFYKDLLAKYPDAKVILTERPAEDWYKSMRNTFLTTTVSKSGITPDHPQYAFYKLVANLTLDGVLRHPEKFSDEAYFKQMFLDHNEEVKRVVPAEQLYVMQIGEGWESVCRFLGKDVPELPYPNQNNTDSFNTYTKTIDAPATTTNKTGDLKVSSST